MKTGLVLGKFLPLHKGHMALVEFALQHCDRLIVLVCATAKESIPGDTRRQWLQATYHHQPRIQTQLLEYNDEHLPNTSVSSREASRLWAAQIGRAVPGIDILFSSEPYGDYVAEYLKIEHQCFDIARIQVPICASAILQHPIRNWEFIAPAARSFFVKKICISGSESTGKS
ncbi:MAG TPA: adenylyltransferase/cytidyltransferase family protein, partial [Chitinophagaceae bacterium]|nr:adenylyltransferase/cytidyltransferase family protein [Chitinophagaceae bacterium]